MGHSEVSIRLVTYALLFGSIILHEVTHGWVALSLGDDTAKRAGRLSLNPLVHVDVLGTIILPAILVLSNAGFIFGWAKPVPVNVSKLRHPRNGAVYTGLAGPAMNLVLMGVAWLALAGRAAHDVLARVRPVQLRPAQLVARDLQPAARPAARRRRASSSGSCRRSGGARTCRSGRTRLLVVMGVVFLGSRTGATNTVFNGLVNWWSSVTGIYFYPP